MQSSYIYLLKIPVPFTVEDEVAAETQFESYIPYPDMIITQCYLVHAYMIYLNYPSNKQ